MQMTEIEKEKGCMVVAMIEKVKAHLTLAQAQARGEDSKHAGNEKADLEAGFAAGAIDSRDRQKYERRIANNVRWMRDMANGLDKQQWFSFKQVGKAARVPARRASGEATEGPHVVCWDGQLGRWSCALCGTTSISDSKWEAIKRVRRVRCLPGDIMEGIGNGHQLQIAWMHGRFSMIFCLRCGWQRIAKGRGLLGDCTPRNANPTRVKRFGMACHPVTGTHFDLITSVGYGLWRLFRQAKGGLESSTDRVQEALLQGVPAGGERLGLGQGNRAVGQGEVGDEISYA